MLVRTGNHMILYLSAEAYDEVEIPSVQSLRNLIAESGRRRGSRNVVGRGRLGADDA